MVNSTIGVLFVCVIVAIVLYFRRTKKKNDTTQEGVPPLISKQLSEGTVLQYNTTKTHWRIGKVLEGGETTTVLEGGAKDFPHHLLLKE